MLSYALIVSQVDFFIARNWCYLVCITVVLCTKKTSALCAGLGNNNRFAAGFSNLIS
jgi:hypothetical protein